jgi:hypothetical protein
MAIPLAATRPEVVVSSSRKVYRIVRAKLAEYFELVLTAAGVFVAISLTFAQLDQGTQGRALTFLVWFQGFLIWAVRRHSMLARARLIRKLRAMLQDRVNNQLTVLVGVAELRGAGALEGRPKMDDVETALTAARAVSQELESLSLESLRVWEDRYARHLPGPLR